MVTGKRTDNEIMERLQAKATSKGVNLTYTHMLFFLKLLSYVHIHGTPCQEGCEIFMSIADLSRCLSLSGRMVTQSLQVLNKSGIIIRRDGQKKFPRSTSVTILKKEYYEWEEQ